MSSSGSRRTPRRRLLTGIAVAVILVLTLAGTALAGLVGGSLPGSAFTFTSTTVNAVNMDGNGIHLKAKGPIDVKTTYTRLAPTGVLTGWHYHNGPVVVTVAIGTITYLDASCREWDVSAGQSYIESTGEVLNAYLDPVKNSGLSTVEWFTTRLYPAGAADPVGVATPCTP
jgi:hypothetical protein